MQTTFPRLLLKHAAERGAAPAMREKEYGIWQSLSWSDLSVMVEHLACGLHQAGLQRDEHMVVVGANRPRLYATMLAAQSLGAVPIPLYQDAAALECVFPINNAEVRFAFAEDQEQVDKLLEIREKCPQLAHIFFDDPRGLLLVVMVLFSWTSMTYYMRTATYREKARDYTAAAVVRWPSDSPRP